MKKWIVIGLIVFIKAIHPMEQSISAINVSFICSKATLQENSPAQLLARICYEATTIPADLHQLVIKAGIKKNKECIESTIEYKAFSLKSATTALYNSTQKLTLYDWFCIGRQHRAFLDLLSYKSLADNSVSFIELLTRGENLYKKRVYKNALEKVFISEVVAIYIKKHIDLSSTEKQLLNKLKQLPLFSPQFKMYEIIEVRKKQLLMTFSFWGVLILKHPEGELRKEEIKKTELKKEQERFYKAYEEALWEYEDPIAQDFEKLENN